jgi:maleylacetate reductase
VRLKRRRRRVAAAHHPQPRLQLDVKAANLVLRALTLPEKPKPPAAQTHATVLPYVLAFNAPFAPEADARIADAFGATSGLEGLNELRRVLDAPRALKDYGFTEDNIPEAVSIFLPLIPADNPRTPTTENLTELLHAAWAGSTPKSD